MAENFDGGGTTTFAVHLRGAAALTGKAEDDAPVLMRVFSFTTEADLRLFLQPLTAERLWTEYKLTVRGVDLSECRDLGKAGVHQNDEVHVTCAKSQLTVTALPYKPTISPVPWPEEIENATDEHSTPPPRHSTAEADGHGSAFQAASLHRCDQHGKLWHKGNFKASMGNTEWQPNEDYQMYEALIQECQGNTTAQLNEAREVIHYRVGGNQARMVFGEPFWKARAQIVLSATAVIHRACCNLPLFGSARGGRNEASAVSDHSHTWCLRS
jgi:hypothetical protein